MGIDTALRQVYEQLPNDRLVEVAKFRAGDLTEEALRVLRDELARRGLDADLAPALAAQLTPVDGPEHRRLLASFRSQPCPLCRSAATLLNAAEVHSCQSFLILSVRRNSLVIGCLSCVNAAIDRADGLTMLAGWWCLPVGPIWSVMALRANARAKKSMRNGNASEALVEHVRRNRGELALRLGGDVPT